MEKRRSIGITIFGFIVIIFAIFGLLGSISFMLAPTFSLEEKTQLMSLSHIKSMGIKNLANFDFMMFFIGMVGVILFLYVIIAGICILKLRNWARMSIVIISVVLFSVNLLLSIFSNQLFSQIPFFLTYSVLIYYFTRPKVREQFE